MKHADPHAAVKFINDSYFGGLDMAALHTPTVNVPGRIEFRIPRVMFSRVPDLYAHIRQRMHAAHPNVRTVEVVNSFGKVTCWYIDKRRRVAVAYQPGRGTFISLIDAED
jgi:hypothetical protein